jgi:citrate lyase beta subunit
MRGAMNLLVEQPVRFPDAVVACTRGNVGHKFPQRVEPLGCHALGGPVRGLSCQHAEDSEAVQNVAGADADDGDAAARRGARVDTNFVPVGEYPGDFWHYARNKVIVAARIGGIDAIDAPYPDFKDVEGYERDARRTSLLGYTGKWAIHPGQVPIANTVYSPTADEIARARCNVTAYREAEANGRGAVGVDGVLVDAAHVKMAEETLARAAAIGMASDTRPPY